MAYSDLYQYKYSEISCDPRYFNTISDCKGLYKKVTPNQTNIDELREQLGKEMVSIAKAWCTESQWKHLHAYYFLGKTQSEIASSCGINQTTVHKSIYGNICYRDTDVKRYGGAIRKIRKLSKKSRSISSLMEKLSVEKSYAEELLIEEAKINKR